MAAKYDQIGINYNQTRKADPYIASKLYGFLQPTLEGKYLDIGCGTGNYTSALHQMGLDFTGVDPSLEMLSKAKASAGNIHWIQAAAEALPFENESFDGAIATLTTHHWRELENSFREIYRVLKTGGRFVIFTSTPQQMGGYWLGHYLPKMMQDSIQQMPSLERVGSDLTGSGFVISALEKYFIREGHEDLFLYAGKHMPSLYLDSRVRQGISSFSSLANQAEVEAGLKYLAEDIASGFVQHLINEWENDEGDYLFIVAEKLGH